MNALALSTGATLKMTLKCDAVLSCAQEDLVMGSNRRGRAPRCLVLAPTRELAQQVQREFQTAAPTLSCGAFYGGASKLRSKFDIHTYKA